MGIMVDETVPVPQGLGELLGLSLEELNRKIDQARVLGERGVNVTGLPLDDIVNLAAKTGWAIMVDRHEGGPKGGSFFLQNPNYEVPQVVT